MLSIVLVWVYIALAILGFLFKMFLPLMVGEKTICVDFSYLSAVLIGVAFIVHLYGCGC